MLLSPICSATAFRCAARSARRSRCADTGGAGVTFQASAAYAAVTNSSIGAMARAALGCMDVIINLMPAENPFQDPLRFERRVPECVVVIFGANGDLTKRKLMPALYRLGHDPRPSPAVCW